MAAVDPLEDKDLMTSLGMLTGDLLPVRKEEITVIEGQPVTIKGRYYLNEEDLSDSLKGLLHGRAFVADKDTISEVSSAAPRTYYISADKSNGLIVPGRSMAIGSAAGAAYVSGNAHFRWTDDGERWTSWITMPIGKTFSFLPDEQVRFAEVQVYADSGNIDVSLIVTR
jgi:hypothetical protein